MTPINSNAQPAVVNNEKCSTATISCNDQGVDVVTNKAITNPTDGISLSGDASICRKRKDNNDTTTTVAITDDQVTTNTAISDNKLSPKLKRIRRNLYSDLNQMCTTIDETKRVRSRR